MDIQTQYDLLNPVPLEEMPPEGYALVTIAAGNITEYHGKGVPAYARLYANQQFTAVDGVVVGQGSIRKPDFYQEFKAEQNGPHIFVYDGDAYATTNSNVPGATYTLAVYDANGRVLITPYTRLRIPHTESSTTWLALEGFSRGVHLEYPPTYLDSIALYQIIAGLVAAQPPAGQKAEIHVHNDLDWRVVHPQLAAAKVVDKHLSTFASVASLIGEASANPTRPYIVTVDKTEKVDNMTFPDNLFFDYNKGYGLYVNAGQVASITPPVNAPPHLLFDGPGQARIKKHYAFKNVDAVWYVPPGSQARANITYAMSEQLRYAIFNNNGGEVLFPIGEYGINHFFLLQRGGVRGAANDANGWGTVLVRTGGLYDDTYHYEEEGQASIFRFLPGGVNMFIKDMVLKSETANTAAMLARDDGLTPPAFIYTIDGIFIDNVTVLGCAEAYKVHDLNAAKSWQVHNVFTTRRTSFLGQTVACVSIDAVNSGGDFTLANCRPAPNGVAVDFKGHTFAKVRLDYNGIGVQGHAVEPELPESVQFNFNPSDIVGDTLTHAKAAGLENADRVYLETTDTLPAPLKPHTAYWWNKPAKTFHRTVADAVTGTGAIALTDQGVGFHNLNSTRPNPELTSQQPFAAIEILGDFSEGLTVEGLKRDEGNPWLLYIHEGIGANMSASIDLINCVTLAQSFLGSSHRINLHGGQYRTQSFKDAVGSQSIIHNIGANLFTYGVGGVQSGYGGYTPPDPKGFADFKGNSFFEIDHRFKPPTPADLSVAGQATFDLSESDEFELYTDTDRALNFVGGHPSHSKKITVWVFSVANVSLSQGAGCVLPSGPLLTGNFPGARYALEFYWDKLYAIEMGRKLGSYANPKLTGNVEISGPTGNLAIKGRDDISFVRFYSDPSGKVRIFADIGASDMFTMDRNEAIFSPGIQLKLESRLAKKGQTIMVGFDSTTDAFEVVDSAGLQRFLIDKNGTIGTKVGAAPADADIDNGELFYYFDTANSKVKFKAKLLDGTVKTGEVPLA